jgi:hypothetical protein
LTDFGSLLQSAVTLASFLIGVSAFLPKGLEEEWYAYMLFLVPSPVLFLIDAVLAAYSNDLALPFFFGSVTVLALLFIGLGIWSTWEKYSEHHLKNKLRMRNSPLFKLLTAST